MSETGFQTAIKEVFFETDLKANYIDVINFYRSVDILKETKTEGCWTFYPPLSGLRLIEEKIISHTFKFLNHPKFLSLKEGKVVIEAKGKSEKDSLPDLQIYYSFTSKEIAEEDYEMIIKKFDKLTTYKWKQDFEIIKVTNFYSSSNHKDGIRLSLYQLNNLNTLTISLIR